MRATTLTACAIGALVILWLASGQLGEDPPAPAKNIAEQNNRVDALNEEKPATRVQVQTIHASPREKLVTIRGRTESKRSVVVRSQITGVLEQRPVERGDRVKAGDLLCRISVEDRDAQLAEAMGALNQAKIEYEGSKRLSQEGLQSETAIAQAKARLASAQANVRRSQLDRKRLTIEAPFDGVVETVDLELGEYVTPGSACVTLVDPDPMLLVGSVSELDLPTVSEGQIATAKLPSGRELVGEVTFVAHTANEMTRTYSFEVHVDNPDYSLASGISAEISIPVETISAQKISPALLTLDDHGAIGVRSIDAYNTVHFHEINVIGDEADGVWVEGLPDVVTVITVGQQLVVPGEIVNPTHGPLTLLGSSEENLDEIPN